MNVRTSRAHEASYDLLANQMVERNPVWRYYLNRLDLKTILPVVTEECNAHISVGLTMNKGVYDDGDLALMPVTQGKTQRGKKFIQIGCKRFVGENRRKLIAWANGAK